MKYFSLVSSVCKRYISDQDDVKDTIQDCFIKIYSNLNKYDFSGSIEGWIRKLVVNTCLDQIRKNKRIKFVFIDDNDTSFELKNEEWLVAESETDCSFETLQTAIAQLEEHHRLIIQMAYVDQLSHKEIGNILKVKEITSRSKLRRAKEQLLSKINERDVLRMK